MCKIYIHIYVRWGWWLLNFFLFPFLTIKITVLRTFVYTVKVKQAKETNKQNLEYFKMINRRFTNFEAIEKCCCHSPGQCLWSACVFVFTKGQLFFVWVLVFFVSTNFSIHSYLQHKSTNRKQLYYHKDSSFNYTLLFVLMQQNTVTFFFYSISQLETTIQWLRKFEQKIICDEKV